MVFAQKSLASRAPQSRVPTELMKITNMPFLQQACPSLRSAARPSVAP